MFTSNHQIRNETILLLKLSPPYTDGFSVVTGNPDEDFVTTYTPAVSCYL
jgi:hypothetical protein